MNGNWIARSPALLIALVGCGPPAVEETTNGQVHELPVPVVRESVPAGTKAEVSWDTPRDEQFAAFLRDNAGGMIRQAAVGIEKKGMLQVVLDESVAPEETLDLTNSLMAGARKDFPDRKITLSVFDPSQEPILKARFEPGVGVQYDLVDGGVGGGVGGSAGDVDSAAGSGEIERAGKTERDQAFALWAMETGRDYLRYVQADLERNGRLWFGVSREVDPSDVPDLTRSLLQGARDEFSGKELIATVFDPEGEKIGRAILDRGGEVRWER